MIFKDLIKNNFDIYYSYNKQDIDPSNITVYPISEYNLEGLKILYDNSRKAGENTNANCKIATVDPLLWFGDFLDKHFDKLNFVSSKSEFSILKIEKNVITNKKYFILIKEFESEEEFNKFFYEAKYKNLVLFSIVKLVDLLKLKVSYKIRYTDITEKHEIRDKKINEIIK